MKKTFRRCPINFISIPKNLKISTITSKMFLCKCSFGHIDCSFDNTAKIFSVNSKFFRSMAKIDQKTFLQKSFSTFFFARTRMLQLSKSCHYFSKNSPNFSAQSPNILKKQFFKVNFPQNFALYTWIAVLTHLDSFFAKRQKNSRSNSKNETKKHLWEKSSKRPPERAEYSCDNPGKNIPTEGFTL